MENKTRKFIVILVAIILIVTTIVIIINKKEKQKNNGNMDDSIVISKQDGATQEFVQILEDGTKFNTSNKLKEKKNFEGMEISDLQLTEKDNVTLLLGTITNTSNTKQGEYPVNIKMKDKEGNEIITVSAYIGELEPGETTQLSTSATFDYANAYDFSIAKKDIT